MNGRTGRRCLRGFIARLLLAALMMAALPITALSNPRVAAAAAMNTGNPYTNGALSKNADGYYFLNIWGTTGWVEHLGSYSPPNWTLPVNQMASIAQLPPSYIAWGQSDFQVHFVSPPAAHNPNNINIGTPTTRTHCIEHDFETTSPDIVSSLCFPLISMNHDAQSGLYTGTFVTYFAGQFGMQTSVSRDPFTVTWQDRGTLKINKTSANPALSGDNNCYTLDGATYGVYASVSSANAETGALATLSLSGNGTGSISPGASLVAGTYYVKETHAPNGYLPDAAVHPVDVAAGQTTTLAVQDEPGFCPGQIIAIKTDHETGAQTPQGAASLAQARFTVRYFAGLYASGDLPQAATRTWVLATDTRGCISLADASAQVGGDALYLSAGNPVMPYGTYVCTETQASPGYLLPDTPRVFVTRVAYSATSANHVTISGDLFPTDGNAATTSTTQPEQVIRGDVEIAKISGANNDVDQQSGLSGIVFALTSMTTGKTYAITTNDNGFATTKALIPAGSGQIGALPYDTYLIHEERDSVPAGLAPVKDFTAQITTNGQRLQYVLNDASIESPVQLVKVDATTGKAITASRATFEILDEHKNVIAFNVHSPREETVTRFTTDKAGQVTLPERLPWGLYYAREITAPVGYLRGADAPFSVTEKHDWGDPLRVTLENVPQMARVEPAKLDLISGEPLLGALYGLYAADDIVTGDGTLRAAQGALVDTISLDSTATAISSQLVFCGSYVLRELLAPSGYLIDSRRHEVNLAPDQQVETVQVQATVQDDYTKVTISKLDLVSGRELEGAQLMVIDAQGSVVATWTTDGAPHRIDRLDPGDYLLREKSAPEGYLISEEVPFTVKASGEIQKVVMKDDREKPAPIIGGSVAAASVPDTGDHRSAFALALAALLAGTGGVFLASRQLRRSKRKV